MRIAQIATLATPVRQERSDSIEYLVWLLTRELTRLGHEVTVFAARGSEVDGELVATLPGTYGSDGVPDDWQLCEWINLCRAIEQSDRFDVIHSHAYLWGLPMERLAREGQLASYKHAGFWYAMDTLRDKNHLEALWRSGRAPWDTWS